MLHFVWIEKYRAHLGIKAQVYVHSLRRAKQDNLRAPEHVLELLEEYIDNFIKQYLKLLREIH